MLRPLDLHGVTEVRILKLYKAYYEARILRSDHVLQTHSRKRM